MYTCAVGDWASGNRGLIFCSILAARFVRHLDFVEAGMLHREQDPAIGLVGDQAQQLSLLVVLLDESQSAISNGARVGHGFTSRMVSCRSGPV
jgi:hypothetical protein